MIGKSCFTLETPISNSGRSWLPSMWSWLHHPGQASLTLICRCHGNDGDDDGDDDDDNDDDKVGRAVKEFLHREGIHSTTVQLEYHSDQRWIKLIYG